MIQRIGFTGSRLGMTVEQQEDLRDILRMIQEKEEGVLEFHHGDCVGSDKEAHEIAEQMGFQIVIHPPLNPSKRAFCRGTKLPEKEYLERNLDIIRATDVMIGAPATPFHRTRSGTWWTIKKAKELGREVFVI